MTIHVNIQFSAKEGRAKEAAENMANKALPMTRKQPGCLSLEFSGDIEKNEFCVWGNWRSIQDYDCLLYTSPSPRDVEESRMPSSA